MKYLLIILTLSVTVHANAQFTGAVWAGTRSAVEDTPPVPYEPETLQYIDTLVANSIDTTAVYAVNWLIWSLKGNNPSYPYNYWDSVVNVFPIHGASEISHAIDLKNVAGAKIEWGGGTPPTHIWRGARGTGAGYGTLPARPDSIWMRTGSYAVLLSTYSIVSGASDNITYGSTVRWGGINDPTDAFYIRWRTGGNGGIQQIGVDTCFQNVDPIASNPTINFNGYFEHSDSTRVAYSTGVYNSYKCDFLISLPPTQPSILAYRFSTNSGGTFQFGSYAGSNAYSTGVLVYEGRLDVQKSLWLTDMFKVYNEKMLR